MLIDKNAAANSIDAIIHEVLTAPIKLLKKTSMDSCLVKIVSIKFFWWLEEFLSHVFLI